MSAEDRTCRYCGHRFDTEADREAHIPCPENTGDSKPMTPYEAGYSMGQMHAEPDATTDPRWEMAAHSRKGTLEAYMRGFNDGYEGKERTP